MAESLLSYLTTRNPTVLAFARPAPSFTFNYDWDPIENIREWSDFNYNNLQSLFKDELSRSVSPFNTTVSCENGGYNKIFDERGLSDLICMSIMGPVSAVLPSDSFTTSAGRVTQHPGCVPDWAAGKEGVGRSKAIVLGDTKFNWSSTNVFNVIQGAKNKTYEDSPSVDLVRPIEQVQYYGAVYGCRYVYLISDQELVVMRLHLASTHIRTSPRPQRTRPPPSHQRVTSSSTISKQLTDMSIDESCFKASIGLVEYKEIPWNATSGLTIKMALYCLVRLADKYGNDLKHDYPSLASKVEPSVPQSLSSTTIPSSQPRNPIPTASTVGSTPQTSNNPANKYYTTTLIWNTTRTAYIYKANDGKYVTDDSPSKWRVIGDKIYKFEGFPPYPCSDIPR
ncbi:Serine/threonine-protein kinase ULK2 [Penicillium digitatum]|uniref:Uncharacterized protein n=3 Tax=Penicillium digitatum TaxID=36651 RepID=K9GQZ5_PEND2|nr:hypothetical protein PDIP_59780 [Penicillium digitatum Pd1]EKV10547.1 hypothetical protein PDIP_59780 [Penicillium digitatum Pd1]EKV15536.1 hypothetical protein PDIG_25290 [Penicillium digitatum PHI26]QQK44161.1 Serine/threonine-protein kinase ULK2 [Penicillium digitatum]